MAKVVKYHNGSLIEYEIYKLVDFYDPILRQPTIPVKLETAADRKNADTVALSLAETLAKSQGLGLSANQCGRTERMFAINMGEQIWTLINPEIIEKSDTLSDMSEGCLSYPGLYLKLKRPDHIKIKFQAINGEWIEQEFDGLTAVCVQHEIDHLDGKMFTDLVSPIKLDLAKKKVKQNMKRWKKYIEQQELLQKQMTSQQVQPVVEKQEPKIQILGGSEALNFEAPKEPAKFVYNQG
jgi:peptide deformylase